MEIEEHELIIADEIDITIGQLSLGGVDSPIESEHLGVSFNVFMLHVKDYVNQGREVMIAFRSDSKFAEELLDGTLGAEMTTMRDRYEAENP